MAKFLVLSTHGAVAACEIVIIVNCVHDPSMLDWELTFCSAEAHRMI